MPKTKSMALTESEALRDRLAEQVADYEKRYHWLVVLNGQLRDALKAVNASDDWDDLSDEVQEKVSNALFAVYNWKEGGGG